MNILYCDICNVPIKETDYYMIYIRYSKQPTSDVEDYYNNYGNYLKKVDKQIKDICPECKRMIDRILELRKARINELYEEILRIDNTPPKEE